MCTAISRSDQVRGAAKGAGGWFPLARCTVGFDHSTHTPDEHAVLIDFANYGIGTDARVGVELDLDSARVLLAQLQEAVDRAEALDSGDD
ncbi:MAG TPA: DUF6295 family protein [Acidimicrobiales bacterium]|nr:DUF6295 family protein [Acidimicrobiales bacterium]